MAPLKSDWWQDDATLQKFMEDWSAKLRKMEEQEIEEFQAGKGHDANDGHLEVDSKVAQSSIEVAVPTPSRTRTDTMQEAHIKTSSNLSEAAVPMAEENLCEAAVPTAEDTQSHSISESAIAKEVAVHDEKPEKQPAEVLPEEKPEKQPEEVLPEEKPEKQPEEVLPEEKPEKQPEEVLPEEKPEKQPEEVLPEEKPEKQPEEVSGRVHESETVDVPAEAAEACAAPESPAQAESSIPSANGSSDATREAAKEAAPKEETAEKQEKAPMDPEAVRAAAQKTSDVLGQLLQQPLEYEVREALPCYSEPDASSKEIRTLSLGQHVRGYPGGGWLKLQVNSGSKGWAHIGRNLALTCLVPTIRARYLEAIDVAWPGFADLLKPGVKAWSSFFSSFCSSFMFLVSN